MSQPPSAPPRWSIHELIARLDDHETVSGRIELNRPDLGLTHLGIQTASISGRLLGVTLGSDTTPHLVEAYPRGPDLIAVYEQPGDPPLRVQLSWELASSDATYAKDQISLVVSAQTSAWESFPSLSIVSQLPAESVFRLTKDSQQFEALSTNDGPVLSDQPDTDCLLFRLPAIPWSYCEMVHPSDGAAVTLSASESGELGTRWQLLGGFLEKGVIRRARMLGTYLPRQNDMQTALNRREAFLARPLPLTT